MEQSTNSQQWKKEVEDYHRRGNTNDLVNYVESLINQVIEEIPDEVGERTMLYHNQIKTLKQHLTTKFLGGHNDR